jgi:putative ABC transport system permease protein
MLITYGAYVVLSDVTGMPLVLTPARASLVIGLTIVMCVASGLMAVGKVKKVDPADVF